jgi:ATP-dependent Lon protease
MNLPGEIAVMTLPNATLFPQALLPLFIFEPRYRRMLDEVLASHRMFCVAMQKPGCRQERPANVAGLGLVRAAVKNSDGTSYLILQGLTRVELGGVSRYRPYRVQRIRPVQPPPCDEVVTGALVLQVRDLLSRRFQLNLPLPFPIFSPPSEGAPATSRPLRPPTQEIFNYLENLTGPEQVADLVSCALLEGVNERQKILETFNVEARLQQLIRFLIADLRRHQP